MLRIAAGVFCIGSFCIVSATPVQDKSALRFEVASIKPENLEVGAAARSAARGPREFFGCHGTDGPARGSMGQFVSRDSLIQVPVGRCIGIRTSLGMLLENAYGVPRASKKVAAPDWIESERFVIEAKSDRPSTGRELQEMVRTLLVERFKLSFHYEMQQADGLVLSMAKGGLRIKQTSRQDEEPRIRYSAPEPGLEVVTTVNAPFPQFFREVAEIQLHNLFGLPAIDKTGLEGNYDITLGPFVARNEPRFSGPTIFEAFQELGLRLDRGKIPLQVIVIDHVEKPTPNDEEEH
jgi:uncharacterized protein (TIGR03435 family)